ncbi:MAG: hypothetical protein H6909_02135 [Rickettsiaceae bacterium]|nr:hypothetical protein [Rickettsiaceae bacterium]
MIDYQLLIDEAILGVIKTVLQGYASTGPQYDQCFYITFNTRHPQVKLSQRVKKKHPYYITIVLENQFDNLLILDDHFTVNLFFGGIKENISVPFRSIISFVDPGANFNLQLQQEIFHEREASENIIMIDSDLKTDTQKVQNPTKVGGAQIIDFDHFRKKKK